MSQDPKLNYIKSNIELIQTPSRWEKETEGKRGIGQVPFRNRTELKKYLYDRLNEFSQKEINRIYDDWKNKNFIKARIKDLAIKNYLYKTHLENTLYNLTKKKLIEKYPLEKLNEISNKFVDDMINDYGHIIGVKAIKSELIRSFPDNLYFAIISGFFKNLTNIKEGEDSTFFGQAAQFLFLARALRAGYNASNVDLPSSKYDAILDNGKKTVKIQIKGFEGDGFAFFTRARGGQGIDSTDITNQQERITSEMCDFYVGVSHRAGTCYIIPMTDADEFSAEKAKNVKISDIQKYKEAWDLFEVK